MSAEDEIRSSIEASRKESDDGALVTYDLTSGIDFSNPRKVAEAMAKVFFDTDADKWFKVTGDHVDFDPSYKVRFVLAEEHHKKIEKTVDDFLGDLQKDEIYPTFSKQIDDVANRASKVSAAVAGGAIRSAFFKHYDRKDYDDYVRDDLFLDILEKLEIRSLNDKDLMDWKNLPL